MDARRGIQKIERRARGFMQWDLALRNTYGWESDEDVDRALYRRELQKKLTEMRKKLPPLYYHIFEDANFPLLAQTLSSLEAYAGPAELSQKAYKEFEEYRMNGGKTYQLRNRRI